MASQAIALLTRKSQFATFLRVGAEGWWRYFNFSHVITAATSGAGRQQQRSR